MTASEKLRALMADEGGFVVVGTLGTPLHEAGTSAPADVVLRNALPLIADVVEAAEEETSHESPIMQSREQFRLAQALTALRDHLERGTDDAPPPH